MEYCQVSSCCLHTRVKENHKNSGQIQSVHNSIQVRNVHIKPIPSVILTSPVFRETQHDMWELTADRDIFRTLKNCIDCLHGTLSLNSAVYLHRSSESFISILEAFQLQM
jgi:hypothetical protein